MVEIIEFDMFLSLFKIIIINMLIDLKKLNIFGCINLNELE